MRKFIRMRPRLLSKLKLVQISQGIHCGERNSYRFQIWRGGCSLHKVKRWLRAAGIDQRFVTDKMKERHIHPRRKRKALNLGTIAQQSAIVEHPAGKAKGAFAAFEVLRGPAS